MKDKNPDEVVA